MLRPAKMRTRGFWALSIAGVAAFGCSASAKQGGEPSGSGGGVITGGSGSGVPTGGSGNAVGGSAGTEMTSVGGAGSGGAPGSGGVVVPDPPGPGIPCGETTCAEGAEMCCIGDSDPWCDTYQCSAAIARLECDDSADCPGSRCCYTNISAANAFLTACMSDCADPFEPQVCREAAECDNGEACRVFVCGNADVSFTLGFCAATAPMFCE